MGESSKVRPGKLRPQTPKLISPPTKCLMQAAEQIGQNSLTAAGSGGSAGGPQNTAEGPQNTAGTAWEEHRIIFGYRPSSEASRSRPGSGNREGEEEGSQQHSRHISIARTRGHERSSVWLLASKMCFLPQAKESPLH